MTTRCGSPGGYQDHVRDRTPKCSPCRRAHAAQRADYRRRRYLQRAPLSVDVTGTRRRIQALAAIGYSLAEQSRRLGMEKSAASAIAHRTWVSVATAEKMRALYDELSMVPGTCTRARNEAERRGWPPPLAWDDDEIDDPGATPAHAPDRKLGGGPGRNVEREQRVLGLTRAGVSAVDIAARLRINERYVQRVRARYRDDQEAAS